MRDVLNQLTDRIGVRGALVMSGDGVLVAESLGPHLEAEPVAALAAQVSARAAKASASLGLGTTRRIILSALFGRLVLVPLDELVLVVVTEPGLALDRTLLEIEGPAQRIHQLATSW